MWQIYESLIFVSGGLWLYRIKRMQHVAHSDQFWLTVGMCVLIGYGLWLYLDNIPRHAASRIFKPLNLAILPLGLIYVGRGLFGMASAPAKFWFIVFGLPLIVFGSLFAVGYLVEGRG